MQFIFILGIPNSTSSNIIQHLSKKLSSYSCSLGSTVLSHISNPMISFSLTSTRLCIVSITWKLQTYWAIECCLVHDGLKFPEQDWLVQCFVLYRRIVFKIRSWMDGDSSWYDLINGLVFIIEIPIDDLGWLLSHGFQGSFLFWFLMKEGWELKGKGVPDCVFF